MVKISVCVMASPSRAHIADKLYRKLTQMDFYETGLVFDDGSGEWQTGVNSLRCHTDSDWHIVIQDDAIISQNFYRNALKAIENIPDPTLLSFYTGTVKPFPSAVKKAIEKAGSINASYLSFGTLNWGVGIAIPTDDIEAVLDTVKNSRLPYDERIGRYYLLNNKKVYYTYPSIVDHNYKIDSVVGKYKGAEPRKAHRYEPEIIFGWNKRVVEI